MKLLSPADTIQVIPGEMSGTAAVASQPASSAIDLQVRDQETARRLAEALAPQLSTAALSRGQRVAKRVVDMAGALVLLFIFIPALLVTAALIKLDSRGPVLFRQDRVGLGGRTFTLFKLRSMTTDNDDSEHAAYVASLIRGEASSQGGVFKLVGDARVTRIGRVIRRYSIDEIPQLWNVLKGDMSLVGPRPALPREVALYDAQARQRLGVKPGLTGLWQVSGRCELSFSEMIELDVTYGRNWSLVNDLKILAKTPVAAVTARGAA
jgi:lipopolysaccharide/colanic/teichoic acid biosynthesis glycosyltransferase